jgi:hypothetical protein
MRFIEPTDLSNPRGGRYQRWSAVSRPIFATLAAPRQVTAKRHERVTSRWLLPGVPKPFLGLELDDTPARFGEVREQLEDDLDAGPIDAELANKRARDQHAVEIDHGDVAFALFDPPSSIRRAISPVTADELTRCW